MSRIAWQTHVTIAFIRKGYINRISSGSKRPPPSLGTDNPRCSGKSTAGIHQKPIENKSGFRIFILQCTGEAQGHDSTTFSAHWPEV
jgi:hypothetical protein